ncbi:MAG: XTP/dITP diphosphatase [Clostridia bacterium]|nr:XTP/dITP diphosphatase [Clostridia bacterium]
MSKIIVASNNKNKIREIKAKLADMDIEVLSQREAGFDIEVDETGTTFEENSMLKAKAIYELAKAPVIADDGGLEVDFLNGEPGVYSARFCGPDATDRDKYMKILELLKDVPDDKRTARFRCVISYIDEEGKEHAFEGICNGKIAHEPMGEDDFGYDPIFMVGDKSFAQISQDEKNKISHRGRAIDKWVAYLKDVK